MSTWSTPSGPALHPATVDLHRVGGRPVGIALGDPDPDDRPGHRQLVEFLGHRQAELLGSRRSASGDRVRRRQRPRSAERIESGLQLGQPMFGRVQALQFGRRLLDPGQHGVHVLAVPPGQRAQRRLPGQHLLQPGRVGVEIGQVAGQFGRDVDQGHRRLLQLPREFDQSRVGRTRQVVPSRLDQRDRGRSASAKSSGSGQRGHRQPGRRPAVRRRSPAAAPRRSARRPHPGRGATAAISASPSRSSCSRCARSRALARRSARSAASCCHSARSGGSRAVRRAGRRTGRARRAAGPAGAARSPPTGRAPRSATRSARTTSPSGTERPPTCARDRPSAPTDRTAMTLPSSSSRPPAAATIGLAGPGPPAAPRRRPARCRRAPARRRPGRR